MAGITRREFAKAAAVVSMSAAVGATASAQQQQQARPTTAASGGGGAPIRLGFIGLGNRGDQVLSAFLAHKDAQVVAICDLYQPYLDHAAKRIGTDPRQYKDYRAVLDRADVDAVVISTPDHWHALQTIHACQAGKDVYVEKPLSLTIAEGRAMVNAARQNKRVTQVGLHRRSSRTAREMCEFIRGGGVGKVTTARAFHIQNEWPHGIGRHADSADPPELDWDAWCGPAPLRPYNVNRSLYRFRWFYDYSGGQLTNTGAHFLDIIHWALGEDAPRTAAAMGGKVADFDDREVPDTLEAMWTYPSGTLVTFSQYNASNADAAAKPCYVEFRGTKGTVYFRGDSYEVVPSEVSRREYPVLNPLDRAASRNWRDGDPVIEAKQVKGTQGDPTREHARNFLDCVRTREQCNCDVETGHRGTSATIVANIAHRAGAVLEWDRESERFTNNDAANAMLHYDYRKPHELPGVG